ncbi:MAG: 4,5-dihydroxyphthalate decarboxylase [Blastococcus sp.]|nr:4,5-dihydroxyphthalate decarboxylase [Blastococcus sp.]
MAEHGRRPTEEEDAVSAPLPVSYGGLLYWDRTLPLLLGQVTPEGVALDYDVHESAPALFDRQIQEQIYDVSEMSASSFLVLVGRGDDRFVGLPIYVSRNFRQGQIYVSDRSGIAEPADLRGKRVGVLEYQMTAALWIRAFLLHDYGVDPSEIRWQTGGLTKPQWQERLPVDLPSGVSLERIPAGKTLEGMLAAGELDALITAQPPQAFRAGQTSPIRRLFSDYEATERAYYQRTGLFPVMHLVVIRRDVYEANRWLARSLLEAFEAAKEQGQRRLRAITGLAVGLPWLAPAIDTVDQMFGGDAFPYGMAPNERVLEAMTQYAHEQGLTPRKVDVGELCAPETV